MYPLPKKIGMPLGGAKLALEDALAKDDRLMVGIILNRNPELDLAETYQGRIRACDLRSVRTLLAYGAKPRTDEFLCEEFGPLYQDLETLYASNPNDRNENSVTNLMLAAYENYLDLIHYYIENFPLDYDAQDEAGNTALIYALQTNEERSPNALVIRELLILGADVTLLNCEGHSALDYSLEVDVPEINLKDYHGNTILISLLIHVYDILKGDFYLMPSRAQTYLPVVQILLNLGVDPQIRNDLQQNAFYWASLIRNHDLIQLLLAD